MDPELHYFDSEVGCYAPFSLADVQVATEKEEGSNCRLTQKVISQQVVLFNFLW